MIDNTMTIRDMEFELQKTFKQQAITTLQLEAKVDEELFKINEETVKFNATYEELKKANIQKNKLLDLQLMEP